MCMVKRETENEPHCCLVVNKKTITISLELRIKDIFNLQWGPDEIEIKEFGLYETISFNLGKGHTFVSLIYGNGEKLQVNDISNLKAGCYKREPIFELINKNDKIKESLKTVFEMVSGSDVPFQHNDLTMDAFIIMTKLTGYDGKFYYALPYSDSSDMLEKRFLRQAKKMHNASNIPKLLDSTKLPRAKSIRKILYKHPALLFFTEELEKLWKIIGDVNWFREVIQSEGIFSKLGSMCKMPQLLHFFAEYRAEQGKRRVYNILMPRNGVKVILNYVAQYYMLSEYDQNIERHRWHNVRWLHSQRRDLDMENRLGAFFSVSNAVTTWQPDLECEIGDYQFKRLKNSGDSVKAGRDLNNCLSKWQYFENNVYGICKQGKYVAAVEVMDKIILQAHAYSNKTISQDPYLRKAFDEWADTFGLTEIDLDAVTYY